MKTGHFLFSGVAWVSRMTIVLMLHLYLSFFSVASFSRQYPMGSSWRNCFCLVTKRFSLPVGTLCIFTLSKVCVCVFWNYFFKDSGTNGMLWFLVFKKNLSKRMISNDLIYMYYKLLSIICLFYWLTTPDRGHELIRSRAGSFEK